MCSLPVALSSKPTILSNSRIGSASCWPPRAVQSNPELGSPWFRLDTWDLPIAELEVRLSQAACIQWHRSIPFHSEIPFDERGFAGYVVVPHSGVLQLNSLHDSVKAVIDKLTWLQMVAPTPAAQKKYHNSLSYLRNIQQWWYRLARAQEMHRSSQSQTS
jgi:hypothetical protein